MEPFLDFYQKHKVAPVHYKVDEDFVNRRNWLYAQLGVPPGFIRGNSVLEFGPGTGDNARVIGSLGPKRYVLVEANPSSISFVFDAVGELDFVEIIESRVLDYAAQDTGFGLVIAENIVPGQRDSIGFANHILNFVEPGGVAILTTATEAGLLADMCRQLLAPEIRNRVASNSSEGVMPLFMDLVELGVEIFSEDLASLGAATRSPADWVIDQVLHDWLDRERTFTPREALASLPPGFDFLSSSPDFGAETRWFKTISGDSPKSMSLFVDALDRNVPALLDYRVPIGTEMANPQEALSTLTSLFEVRDHILETEDYERLPDFLQSLLHLSELLPEESWPTRAAIQDYADPNRGMPSFVLGAETPRWPNFSRWWGRATLYLSLWRLP